MKLRLRRFQFYHFINTNQKLYFFRSLVRLFIIEVSFIVGSYLGTESYSNRWCPHIPQIPSDSRKRIAGRLRLLDECTDSIYNDSIDWNDKHEFTAWLGLGEFTVRGRTTPICHFRCDSHSIYAVLILHIYDHTTDNVTIIISGFIYQWLRACVRYCETTARSSKPRTLSNFVFIFFIAGKHYAPSDTRAKVKPTLCLR